MSSSSESKSKGGGSALRLSVSALWLAGFTAVFAVLIAYVFWGTWSTDFAPVMPDDQISHPIAYRDVLRTALWFVFRNGTFTPTDILWDGLVVSPYFCQELKYAVALWCSGVGLAFFLRGRGLSNLASYGAGMLLAFCGYWMTLFSAGHGGWFVLMSYAIFAFGLADRAIRRGRIVHWLLLGLVVGWGMSYQQDLWLLFTIFTGAYILFAAFTTAFSTPKDERKGFWLRFAKGAGCAALAFAIIGCPGVLASLREVANRQLQIEQSKGTALTGGKGASTDAKGTDAEKSADEDREARWIFVTNWSLPLSETAEFFIPRLNGDTSCPMVLSTGTHAGTGVKPYTGALGRPINASRGNYRQHSLYVGWVTCLLALAGVVLGVTRKDVIFFTVAALIFYLLSLGRYCEPVYRIVFSLPVGDLIRCPVKWHHLTEFCLCVLAGFGLHGLYCLLTEKIGKDRVAMVVVAAIALFGAANLAHCDKFFCGPVDLRVIKNDNAAANEILRRGRGLVLDLVERGNGLVAWSFSARNISTSGDPNAKDIRYIWLPLEMLTKNPSVKTWLRQQGAAPAGTYLLTDRAVRSAGGGRANVALYEIASVPPLPTKPEWPTPKPLSIVTLIISVAGAVSVCIYVVVKREEKNSDGI